MTPIWLRTAVAPDATHHDLDGQPLYPHRFDEVLKFHPPGLAPVRRGDLAWHIDPAGEPAYARRFRRTFGFYEDRAAVESTDGWHHITPDGADAYPERHAWCGNFNHLRCTVRRADLRYLHITPDGRPAYDERWRYAGDFRDGIAVVARDDGRSTHIDRDGRPLHGLWFVDLDVFHKGFACARDERGWLHIDAAGRPQYPHRFAAVEPFYNGQARVETHDGAALVIGESGRTLVTLRHDLPAAELDAGALGGWPLGEELHRGSHGAVYASRPGAVLKSTSNLHAWSREVTILTTLAGDGAPRLLDAFTRAGTGYLAMQRLTGVSLGPRNHTTPRPLALALALARDLAATLARLHALGWLHTDLHPGNVLQNDARAHLLDFASAVRPDPAGRWNGEVHWGRWEFIPPEQFEGLAVLDASTDTYALAGLLVYLVTGRAPFTVDVPLLRPRGWPAVREAFRAARTAPKVDALPPSLRPLVTRALALDPRDRYPTMAALHAALEAHA